jgi:hypothetical protein
MASGNLLAKSGSSLSESQFKSQKEMIRSGANELRPIYFRRSVGVMTFLCISRIHRLRRRWLRDDILALAGRPGDRWAGLRKKAGREESPDTVVFAFCAWDESLRRRAPQTKGQRAW